MSQRGELILTVPREVLGGVPRFAPWEDAESLLMQLEVSADWLPRVVAERSPLALQPIPSAVVTNGKGRFLLLQRVKSHRTDMSHKLTLVVGGHVDDRGEAERSGGFESLMQNVLARELFEELRISDPVAISGLGIVVDKGSIKASRHFAIAYLVTVRERIDVRANEEFLSNAALRASFLPLAGIEKLRTRLDPWSRILLQECLSTWQPKRGVDFKERS